MAAARALGLSAAEKARAAARLGPSLRSMLRGGACPRAPTSPAFGTSASELLRTPPCAPPLHRPRSPARFPPLLPSTRMRVPALLAMPMSSGALHYFPRAAFSTGGNSKEGAFAGRAVGDGRGDDAESPKTNPVAPKQPAAAGGDAQLPKTEPAAPHQADAAAGDDAERPKAVLDEDRLLKKFIQGVEEISERKEVKRRAARRNQTFVILGGVVVELVVVVLGTIVFAGPVIFDYVKRKVHEAVKEDAAKESLWYTIDSVFSYFGHKIATPIIIVGRGATAAGNTIHKGVRKVGVWLYLVKEVPAQEVPVQDKEGASKSPESIVMKMGKIAPYGVAFGTVYGAVNSLLHDGPHVGSNVKYPQLIRTTKVCGHFAIYIAVTGATFVGVEQALARYRMKKDILNGVAAGFACGFVLGFRVKSFRTTFFSGSALALASVLLDVTGMKSKF